MESSFMGSKRLTPTIVGKMALKRLLQLAHKLQIIIKKDSGFFKLAQIEKKVVDVKFLEIYMYNLSSERRNYVLTQTHVL